jgi:hypothetical protein
VDITLFEYDHANPFKDELPIAALPGSEVEGLVPTGSAIEDVNPIPLQP